MPNTYNIFSLKKSYLSLECRVSFSLDEVRDGLELDLVELVLNLGLVLVQEEILAMEQMDVLEEDGHGAEFHQSLDLVEDSLRRVLPHLYE